MRGIWGINPGWGITAVRIAMGIILAVSGWAKFNMGIDKLTAFFAQMGIAAPNLAGPFIMVLELVGGPLLVLGIVARWLGLLYAIEFTVATFYVKFAGTGFASGRLDLMLLAGGILFFLAGPGRAAVDELWLERR